MNTLSKSLSVAKIIKSKLGSLLIIIFSICFILYILSFIFLGSTDFVINFINIDIDLYLKYLYFTSVIISFIKLIYINILGFKEEPEKNNFFGWAIGIIGSFFISIFVGPLIFSHIIITGIQKDI